MCVACFSSTLKDPKQKVGGFIIVYDTFSNKLFLQREGSKIFLSLESFWGLHVSNLTCVSRTTAHFLDARGPRQVRCPKREIFRTSSENHGYTSGALFDLTVRRPSKSVSSLSCQEGGILGVHTFEVAFPKQPSFAPILWDWLSA